MFYCSLQQNSLEILSERIEEEERIGRTTEALLMKGMQFSLQVRATLYTFNVEYEITDPS